MTSEIARRRFTEQVLPHLDDAYSLARWLTGNPTDAADVVQDACMRALRALDGAPVGHPRAWLLAVIRNTAFTWLAKNRPGHPLPMPESDLDRTALIVVAVGVLSWAAAAETWFTGWLMRSVRSSRCLTPPTVPQASPPSVTRHSS